MPGAGQQVDIAAQRPAKDLRGAFWAIRIIVGARQSRRRRGELQPGQIEDPGCEFSDGVPGKLRRPRRADQQHPAGGRLTAARRQVEPRCTRQAVADHDSFTAHHPQLGLDCLEPGSERWPVGIGQLRVEDLLAPLPGAAARGRAAARSCSASRTARQVPGRCPRGTREGVTRSGSRAGRGPGRRTLCRRWPGSPPAVRRRYWRRPA